MTLKTQDCDKELFPFLLRFFFHSISEPNPRSRIYNYFESNSDLEEEEGDMGIENEKLVNPFPNTPFLDCPKFKEAADDN